jgi:hypothetical protein
MSNKSISVYTEALKRKENEDQANSSPISTSMVTWRRKNSRDNPREEIRESARDNPRELPSRDEIQEFSFQLRDELKVKVQAEVPHQWQDELEEIARQLDVKKLELYRFILGEFLGKAHCKDSPERIYARRRGYRQKAR